ncbi:MAG: CCA tRNA nucleotidyltransferase [Fibrobacter sp.]|nr:CCA tRNA nucleotidyltransferase [Fibrobacter sp.]
MVTVRTLSGDEFSPDLPGRLLKIAGDIRAAGGRAFLVGGWVRDAMLGKSCRDYDIEVYDMAQDALVPLLSKYGRTNLVGKAFGVIHLAMKGLSLDFSFPRTENKVGYGHRGFVVHTDEKLSFKEAALRRDFTINAMGMELPELTLCDPYGGVDDLKAHRLKHVSDAFAEDSLRILRGVQFASRFELTLAPETAELCRSLSLEDLSKERIYEEFKKWLLKPGKPSLGLRAFLEMDLLRFFPEVKPLDGSYEKLGQFLDNMSRNAAAEPEESRMAMAFASLLSGNSCAEDWEKFLTGMTNEVKLLRNVPKLLKYTSTASPEGAFLDDSEIRRLSVALEGLREYSILVASNPMYGEQARTAFVERLKARALELGVFENAPEPYLTGRYLMSLGLKPGKQFGDLIRESFELQLDGKLQDAEQAETWAKAKLGL